MYDFVIVGGGVVGASIAYYLSRYDNSLLLIESGKDVSLGASKANSAIIHAGYDPKTGTLKAQLNVKGASLYKDLCQKLNVPFKEQATLVVAKSEEEKKSLNILLKRGEANGVVGGVILEGEELKKKEPLLKDNINSAYYVPSAVASPYELTIALIEVAQENGMILNLNSQVIGIEENQDQSLTLKVQHGKELEEIQARYIINCAGAGSAEIASYLGDESFKINLVRGEYLLFDYDSKYPLKSTIFPLPDPQKGKGVLITLTPDGNILLGPTSDPIDSPQDTSTHLEVLKGVWDKVDEIVSKKPPIGKLIRSFSGIRSKIERKDGIKDFLIGFSSYNSHLYNVAGIDSPGLSSAPAIALYLIDEFKEKNLLGKEKEIFQERREEYKGRSCKKLDILKADEKTRLTLGTPDRIICRCQSVREETIRDAAKKWNEPLSVDGIKRRTRASMGFCQGSYCKERIKEVLADEYAKKKEEIEERDEKYSLKRPPIIEVKKSLLELDSMKKVNEND